MIPARSHHWLAIARELLDREDEDERVRAELAASGALCDGYHPRMAAVHEANAAWLEAIVLESGWPGWPQVGEAASTAAWRILQHAIGRPDLQRRGTEWLAQAVAAGEAPPAHLAYLLDRIAFFEGRPQTYGTQLDWDAHGQLIPWILADPPRVERHRAEVGLPPLAETLEQHRALARDAGEAPPADATARQATFEAWCRLVGWR